jgi:hypothetical protein
MQTEETNWNEEEAAKIGERLKKKQLTDKDYELLERFWTAFAQLIFILAEKDLSIKRLMRLLGKKSEKAQTILKKEVTDKNQDKEKASESTDAESSEESKDSSKTKEKKDKKRGHGRNGASRYVGAETIEVPLNNLSAGSECPDCKDGNTLYKCKPNKELRIKGCIPIKAIIYLLEKVRCRLCQKIFVAELPKEAGDKKYDEEAGSMVAVLKYGSGIPFYRLENLQDNQGVPLPASTQWDIVSDVSRRIFPAYQQLLVEGAQGEILHNDDTHVKILSLMKENEEIRSRGSEGSEGRERKGMFTTGILSKINGHQIALYLSGRKHAGENLSELLKLRISSLSPPIQMCDALSRNASSEFETILANCLAHGRRNFTDILDVFPVESQYVIKQLGKVYRNDTIAKAMEMTTAQRLEFHQKESGPVMTRLKEWFKEQFEEKKVEPNSSLGKAINYMNNHWEKLTLFLRVEGAPIDNNAVERILKTAILNRKNAYFYKNLNGAHTGDMFMSIIQTCKLARVNAFEYLTALQKYEKDVHRNPAAWLPWIYKDTLSHLR